jgi:hypothetical protein
MYSFTKYNQGTTRDTPVMPLPSLREGEQAANLENVPVIPLPTPEQGGPVADLENTPVIPLPTPEQGGPVADLENTPVIPLPTPEQGGPVADLENTPVIPLPTPEQSGPVADLTPTPGITWPGGIVIVPTLPTLPCFFCSNGRFAKVRFLNAAYGYAPFRVFINNRFSVNQLGYTCLSPYGRVSDGFQTITVTGTNGYVYLQKSMPFSAGKSTTIAIVNSASGLDLLQINDTPCTKTGNMSCLRACNLVYNSNPLDVVLYDGRVVYSDLRFKEAGAFKRIRPGDYDFYIAETDFTPQPRDEDIETLASGVVPFSLPEVLVSYSLQVKANKVYTMYLFSRDGSGRAIGILTVEDSF